MSSSLPWTQKSHQCLTGKQSSFIPHSVFHWRQWTMFKTVEAMHVSVSLFPRFSERVLCGRELLQHSLCCCLPAPLSPQTQALSGRRAGAVLCCWSQPLAQLLPSGKEKSHRELAPRCCSRVVAFIKDSAHGKFELLQINDHCAKWLSILTLDSLWI